MRVERTFLRCNAEGLEFHFDGSDHRGQLWPRFDTRPKNARAARAGEKSQAGEAHFDWGETWKLAERSADLFDLFSGNLTDKFQRDMHASQAYPPCIGASLLQLVAQLGKRRAHRIRNIQRHEETHAIPAPLAL